MSTPVDFQYIDIHGHMNFAAYDADRAEVIDRAHKAGVAMITVGTQMDTSKAAILLAEQNENMYATVGLHPVHTNASHHDEQELGEGGKAFTSRGEKIDVNVYRELAKHPKVVAIGECGLDYYHHDETAAALQVQTFESTIDIANEVGKPLMLHIRNGSSRTGGQVVKSAYKDAYEILKSRAKVKGNLHFFAGTIEEAKPFLDLGYSFSFTGAITFGKNYNEVIRYLPLDRIMSETDCPYVSPIPYRGKRNEPAYVIEVVKALAAIRGEEKSKIAAQIVLNANNFFGFNR